MNRRGFFGVLASVAATATLDPERLLWVRGQKLISIPAPGLLPVVLRPGDILKVHFVAEEERYPFTSFFFDNMLPTIDAKIWAQWRAFDGAPVQSRVVSGLVGRPVRLVSPHNWPSTGTGA